MNIPSYAKWQVTVYWMDQDGNIVPDTRFFEDTKDALEYNWYGYKRKSNYWPPTPHPVSYGIIDGELNRAKGIELDLTYFRQDRTFEEHPDSYWKDKERNG